ncbi:MAG: response regulator [Opitutaceae bacterium]
MLTGKRILIADDIYFNRYVNKDLLTKLGACIVEAEDGNKAIERLESETFDIVILDINMPNKSGFEVITEYLRNKPKRGPTFIALSADTTPEIKTKCLLLGFHHFVEKPLDTAKLSKIIRPKENNKLPSVPSHTGSLLSYLADSKPEAADALATRYREFLLKELKKLHAAINEQSLLKIQASLHKLIGLTNLNRSPKISELLERLSEPSLTTEKQLKLCDTLVSYVSEM